MDDVIDEISMSLLRGEFKKAVAIAEKLAQQP
jgi:hypothetical protein